MKTTTPRTFLAGIDPVELFECCRQLLLGDLDVDALKSRLPADEIGGDQ